MIPNIIGQSTSRFDQRFFLTALVPTAVFAPAVAGVLLSSSGRLGRVSGWYTDQTAVSQVLAWLAVAAVVWFLATLLASQWTNIVRLYEGYPLLRFSALIDLALVKCGAPDWVRSRPLGKAAHQRRFIKLKARATAQAGGAPSSTHEGDPAAELYDDYPPDLHRVMPTGLGNLIRATEDYCHDRYGFDTIHLWPRLTVVLPPEYLGDVERALIEYQTPLVVSFWSAVLGLSTLGLANTNISTSLFVAVFLATWAISWASYRLSFRAAREYGDFVRTAVDLYRNDLVERWWPELLTIDDDRRRLQILRDFIITGRRSTLPPGASWSTSRLCAGAERWWQRWRRKSALVGRRNRTLVNEQPSSSRPANEIPAFGIRISLCTLLGAVVMCVFGASVLQEQRWVLVAREDVPAFGALINRVEKTKLRRGSIAMDALASSKKKSQVDISAANSFLVLRQLSDGAVIRRSEVAPKLLSGEPPRLIVQLRRPRAQVEALDLQPGDRVLLVGADASSLAQSCFGDASGTSTTTSTAPSSTSSTKPVAEPLPYVPADLLAILDTERLNEVSVLMNIADEAEGQCLGNPATVQILRRSG